MRGKLMLGAGVAVVLALLALAWVSGGPQPERQITQTISVPELPR